MSVCQLPPHPHPMCAKERTTTSPGWIMPGRSTGAVPVRLRGRAQHGTVQPHVRVLQRIDVDGPTVGMLGQDAGVPGGGPTVERGGEVARAVPVDRLWPWRQVDAVDREPRSEELSEDPQDVVRHPLVQHQRARSNVAREVPVAHRHQAEIGERDRAARVPVPAEDEPAGDAIERGDLAPEPRRLRRRRNGCRRGRGAVRDRDGRCGAIDRR